MDFDALIAAAWSALLVFGARLLGSPSRWRVAGALLATLGQPPGVRWRARVLGAMLPALAVGLLVYGGVAAVTYGPVSGDPIAEGRDGAVWRAEARMPARIALAAGSLLAAVWLWRTRAATCRSGLVRRHAARGELPADARPEAEDRRESAASWLQVRGSVAVNRIPTLDLELELPASVRVLALIGSGGSGKTALLHALAGIPDRLPNARIVFDGRLLEDVDSAGRSRIHVAAEMRGIALCAAEPVAWPGRSVRSELAAGLRAGRCRGAVQSDVPPVVHALELADLLNERADSVSIEAAWRVQLGRALLARPRLLLVDTPRGQSEAARLQRTAMLRWVTTARPELRVLYVARRIAELDDLADAALLLQDGRGFGPDDPWELLGRCAKGPVVEELQLESLLPASVDYLDEEGRWLRVLVASHEIYLPFVRLAPGWHGQVGVPPSAVMLLTERLPGERLTNQLEGRVLQLDRLHGRVSVAVDVGLGGTPLRALVEPDTVRALQLDIGRAVVCAFEPAAVRWIGHHY